MRNVVGAFNESERPLICERTKAALVVARSQGKRLGRPSQQSPEARELATALRAEGLSLRKIGVALEEAGLHTAAGKTVWSPSSVQGPLRTARLDQKAATNTARYNAEQDEQWSSRPLLCGEAPPSGAGPQLHCCRVSASARIIATRASKISSSEWSAPES